MKPAFGTNVAIVLLLGLAAAGPGCSNPEPDPHDPGSVALRLFALAHAVPSEERIQALFDPDRVRGGDVALLDALDRIADSPAPELIGVDGGPEASEAFVDLAVDLPGGGRAVYSVKLLRLDERGWRIGWFQGPGVEWPPRAKKGLGLSTSAPPGQASGG